MARTGRPRVVVERRLSNFPPPTPQPTPCRLWQGRLNSAGYARRADGELMARWVIRMVGEDQHGVSWDPALQVHHHCDQPLCYRYDHLFLGTQADNMADMQAKGRHGRRKLTEQQVRDIRAQADVPARVLADQYGVSPQLIRQVRALQIWRHVDGT